MQSWWGWAGGPSGVPRRHSEPSVATPAPRSAWVVTLPRGTSNSALEACPPCGWVLSLALCCSQ